jgi:hypothetical protein
MDIFAVIAGSLCTLSFITQLIRALNSNFQLSHTFLITYFIGVINWGLFAISTLPINWLLLLISVLQATFVGIILLKAREKNMNSHDLIIKKYVVSSWRLCLGSFLGIILYPIIIYFIYFLSSGLWELISGSAVEPPVIDFMSQYGKPAQNGYWVFVWSAIVSGLLLSALLPSVIGASIGKYLLKIRYVNEKGNFITLRQTFIKTMYNIMYFLILALPGPIIGFSIGKNSEVASLSALFLGFVIFLYLTFKKDQSGRVLSYSKSNIIPIMKKDIELFKKEIGSL